MGMDWICMLRLVMNYSQDSVSEWLVSSAVTRHHHSTFVDKEQCLESLGNMSLLATWQDSEKLRARWVVFPSSLMQA